MSMTIEQARENTGHTVVYRPAPDRAEEGVITGASEYWVFVRYGDGEAPKATAPEALTLAADGA